MNFQVAMATLSYEYVDFSGSQWGRIQCISMYIHKLENVTTMQEFTSTKINAQDRQVQFYPTPVPKPPKPEPQSMSYRRLESHCGILRRETCIPLIKLSKSAAGRYLVFSTSRGSHDVTW